jgi:hypothetical protein
MTKQLTAVNMVSPGNLGINSTQAGTLLPPQYALTATNCVIDSSGRLAARKGHVVDSTTAITASAPVQVIHEYRREAGTSETLVTWDGGIGNSIVDPEGNDVSGAITDADGRWVLLNFNDKCIGIQDGLDPVVYTGTTFATIVAASGTIPSGATGHSAFGRLWILDSDKQTIKYSGLLDETDWGGAGAGQIDMSSVWTDGTDTVTAITSFNGALIVFGKRHIVFWVDGQGSAIGLDPDNIYVTDIIQGTGCLVDFSIQPVGETDLLFLSRNGVQSIARLIQERSSPIQTLSKAVRDDLVTDVNSAVLADIRSVFSPEDGFYLLSVPTACRTWCLDQRRRYPDADGSPLSVVTTWDKCPTAWCSQDDGTLLMGLPGEVATYTSHADGAATYRVRYRSPWLDLGEDFADRLKMLKRIGAVIELSTDTNVIIKWRTDFEDNFRSATRAVAAGALAEFGTAEWGTAEWSSGLAIRILKVPARATGQYFQVSLEVEVDSIFAIQQLELFAKVGRLA